MDGTQQPDNMGDSPQFKPGETISPASAATPAPAPQAPAAQQPQSAPVAAPQQFAQPAYAAAPAITWTASEFVSHHKSSMWYVLLGFATLLLAIVGWFLSKDVFSVIFIGIIGLTFGLVAARKPREIPYQLDESGVSLGVKHYFYNRFRSFSVIPEGAFSSIVFMPLKRFSQITTIYYDPADEPQIVDLLSQRLPYEERSHDMIDRLMWRIRF